MELLIDSAENIEKYACKIVLVPQFQDIFTASLSDSVRSMFKKRTNTSEKDVISVETLNEFVFCVQTAWVTNDEERDELRKKVSQVFNACAQDYTETVILNLQSSQDIAYACIESFYLSSYMFTTYKSEKKAHTLSRIACVGFEANNLNRIQFISSAIFEARNCVNEPVSTLSSSVFAERIEALFQNTAARVYVHNKTWIQEQNMGGLLAVNKGSVDEPRFVHIEWNPNNSKEQALVLVGKGIVFDTGGLSIKSPSSYMETMKADMGGAAAVVGIMKALADMNFPHLVHALIPITDNRLSGNAYAPGDVVSMRSGTTVEVLNTDAEGRMILADALDYAAEFNPKLVIDIATLTGAANAAVGEHAAVCMGTHAEYVQKLIQASMQVWEPLVEFPLWDMYGKLIVSDIADIKNVGGPVAGAITAGKFLQKFVKYPWIHMDISGSAFLKTKSAYKGIGGTGFGIRTIIEFLKSWK